MRTYIISLVVLVATFGAARADRKPSRYVGIHPIPKAQGGGVCHIQAPHIHVYAPADVKLQYRDHDGWSYFVGDPVAYGWDGPKVSYYGHHPVPVEVLIGDDHGHDEYCYLEGPHYHAWEPPSGLSLELRGGAYWYTGDFPAAYVEARPVYDPIDTVYQPIKYERPVVEVSVAPPGWYGAVVVAPAVVAPVEVRPARVQAEVRVPAPSVRVEIAVPTVQIGIGGGIYVGGSHGHKHKYKGKRGHKRGHRHDD
ncbi:MAG: hypothetical protein R3B06_32905 [Kofleriaceae bacterium]